MYVSCTRIEHGLQPWVSYFLTPLFALLNAGVHTDRASQSPPRSIWSRLVLRLPASVGKPFGITEFAWTAERIKLAARPAGVNWRQIFAAGWVCGIGFTMDFVDRHTRTA